MAGMNPMVPRKPPPAAAFALLGQLNEFMAFPAKERAAAFDLFMDATEQREAALTKCDEQVAVAAADRVAAQSERHEAAELAVQTTQDADRRAATVMKNATDQAEAVTKQARKASIAAREEVAEAEQNVKDFVKGFKERERAIRADEQRLEELIKDVNKAEKAAKKEKKLYQELIAAINALNTKAPK